MAAKPIDRRARAAILIVDDDPELCEILVVGLTTEGYRVDCAYTGEDALARIRSRLPIDLVIVDTMLPGVTMGGHVAAEAAARGILVITMSGARDAKELTPPALRKPFRLGEAIQLVHATLDTDGPNQRDH